MLKISKSSSMIRANTNRPTPSIYQVVAELIR